MQKLLLLLVIMSLASCQKKKCWDCEYRAYNEQAGVGIMTTAPQYCDKSEKQIESIKKENEHVTFGGQDHFLFCMEKQ